MSEPMGARLLVAEQLMMVACSADGRLRSPARRYLPMGMAGAVLTELVLRRAISIGPRYKSPDKCLVIGMAPGTGDPLLDGVAGAVLAEQQRTLAWWIRRLSRFGLQGQVVGRMRTSGLITESRGVFTRHLQLTQPAAHADLVARVWQALLGGPGLPAGPWPANLNTVSLWTADPSLAALTSLAFGCRAMTGLSRLPREQRQIAKASLQAIRSTDPIGLAVAVVVERAIRNEQAAAASSIAMMNAGQ